MTVRDLRSRTVIEVRPSSGHGDHHARQKKRGVRPSTSLRHDDDGLTSRGEATASPSAARGGGLPHLAFGERLRSAKSLESHVSLVVREHDLRRRRVGGASRAKRVRGRSPHEEVSPRPDKTRRPPTIAREGPPKLRHRLDPLTPRRWTSCVRAVGRRGPRRKAGCRPTAPPVTATCSSTRTPCSCSRCPSPRSPRCRCPTPPRTRRCARRCPSPSRSRCRPRCCRRR